jgi:hypothetical protein
MQLKCAPIKPWTMSHEENRGVSVNQGYELVARGPQKNPEIGNFYLKKILTPNLVSKVLY